MAPDGCPVQVRTAAPGSRLALIPAGRRKGVWQARRHAMIRPPASGTVPPCPQFGLCGGCTLQELQLDAQRAHKHAHAVRAVASELGSLDGVRIHPVRGASNAYGYRNKVEFSYGTQRWLSEADQLAGLPHQGAFLGFHAPGRFDRIVDAPRCDLISDAMNQALSVVRRVTLADDAPAPYAPRDHTGFWRHLLLREAHDGCLAVVYTTSQLDREVAREWVSRAANALAPHVRGTEWRINDAVADVAQGTVEATWGRPWLEERLGPIVLRVGPDTFLQTNTAGCIVLYDTIAEALAPSTGRGGTLLDLYCGAGAIGLYLASQFERIVGVEERAAAVADAEQNASRNGVAAAYRVARVEQDLDALATELATEVTGGVHVVVDPPRAGLHPSVARALADAQVESLVYVACRPASLGRDGAILATGGWRLQELFTVDLFPQTRHIEMVGRFSR